VQRDQRGLYASSGEEAEGLGAKMGVVGVMGAADEVVEIERMDLGDGGGEVMSDGGRENMLSAGRLVCSG